VDLDPETSTLWFAGKQLQPEKKLADYLGRNENTRAVVKLQKKGAGPPAREPVGPNISNGPRSSMKIEQRGCMEFLQGHVIC
jgi:hypothetical protein